MVRRALYSSALFVAVALGCSGAEHASAPPPADIVLRNGGIYTVDAQRSWAAAAAIRDGMIIAVGDDTSIAPYVGPVTRVVDLDGHLALPGLHDSHVHPIRGGAMQLGSIEVGKQADIIVVDRKLFDIPPEQIGDTQVLLTILNGKVIYERPQAVARWAPGGGGRSVGLAHW